MRIRSKDKSWTGYIDYYNPTPFGEVIVNIDKYGCEPVMEEICEILTSKGWTDLYTAITQGKLLINEVNDRLEEPYAS